jgi:hypothetical protein
VRRLVECSFLNVRFAPDSDRRADMLACLKCAMNGLLHRSKQQKLYERPVDLRC